MSLCVWRWIYVAKCCFLWSCVAGEHCMSVAGGGGSGGSIFIDASSLRGSGSLQAVGGLGGVGCTSYFGGAGSGGRIAVHLVSKLFTGTVIAAGAVVQPNSFGAAALAGGAGTVFWSIGVNRALRQRTLVIDNLGRSGSVAMLTDPGQTSYSFDVISLQNMGRLAWLPAQLTPWPVAATLTAAQFSIGGTGVVRLTVNDYTILSLLNAQSVVALELVVSALGTVITPPSFSMSLGSVFTLSGTLSGMSSLRLSQSSLTVTGVLPSSLGIVVDSLSTVSIASTARSAGLTTGNLAFSSLVVQNASTFSCTGFLSMVLTGEFTVNDASSVSMGSLVRARLRVDTMDLLGSTSYLSFTGALTVEVVTAMSVRVGAYISADGGGYSAGQSACVSSTASFGAGAGGSYGGYGSTSQGVSAGTRMTPCGSVDNPVLMGSGGMNQATGGSPGGGALAILANTTLFTTLTLNGTIRMSGVNYTNGGCSQMVREPFRAHWNALLP